MSAAWHESVLEHKIQDSKNEVKRIARHEQLGLTWVYRCGTLSAT